MSAKVIHVYIIQMVKLYDKITWLDSTVHNVRSKILRKEGMKHPFCCTELT